MLSKILNLFNKNEETTSSEDKTANPTEKASSDWLTDGYSWIPDWKNILGDDFGNWEDCIVRAKGGPKVLISTLVGGNSNLTPLETLFAVALTLRGAEVHFALCDKKLSACQNCFAESEESQLNFIENGPSACDWCFDVGQKSLWQMGLPIHYYSDYVTDEDYVAAEKAAKDLDFEALMNFEIDGINHRETLRAAVLRYFGRCDLENEANLLPVVRRYLTASIVTNKALIRLYEKEQFVHTLSNQAIYVPQGNVVSVANKFNSHLVAWDLGYRQNCLNVCHDETHVYAHLNAPNSAWEDLPWNDRMEARIKEYLRGRWTSKYDWLKVLTEENESADSNQIWKELGVDPDKPAVGLLTNVLWDGQLLYPACAFSSQMEWIIATVKHFEKRSDIQLIIRIHPSEHDSWIKSRQFIRDEIAKHIPELPANVFIIQADSKINTYQAMQNCNAVLIYGTTAGLEMTCMKLPVIAAGEAWIRNKGLCTEVSTADEYAEALSKLPFSEPVSEETYRRALKYAYHFYMRQMIPLEVIEPQTYKNAPYRIPPQKLSNFAAGYDKGLDTICNGILEKTEFHYTTEDMDQ